MTDTPLYAHVRGLLLADDIPDTAPRSEAPVVASQNGWRAGATDALDPTATAEGTLVRFPGGVRRDAPGQLLMAVAGRFHREVEPLVDGHCWGYAYRPIRGSSTVSNHASGTAIDVNAPAHKLGTDPRASFSGAQIDAIHRILATAGGVVRWGGTYTGRKDPMHFEINDGASMADCQRALDALRAGPPPATPQSTVLQKGSVGPAVAKLQKDPMHFEINDGASMADCQRALDALRAGPPPATPQSTVLQKGSVGPAVAKLQEVLNAWYPNEAQLVVDGRFGPATEAMVRYLQDAAGLEVDGRAGPRTLAVLNLA